MKILVVDDDQCNRELLGFILDDLDYLYLEAENGQQACEIVEQDDDIDIILMDVNMPIMDGIAATKKIKASYLERMLPIVFITALDDDDSLNECLAAGGDDFIAKPINTNTLIAKLNAHQRTITLHNKVQENNKELQYHRHVMDREHNIVEHMFRNDMKRIHTNANNINFHISPVTMFNGDVLLVAPSPSGGLYVLLGDFTGHGLSAAIGYLPTADIFYAMTANQVSVGDIAATINTRLQNLLPGNMFFCAAVVELSRNGERLSVWAGGMNDILLIDAEGKLEARIESMHMPLAILDSSEFDSNVQVLQPSSQSRLYIYTDGIIEATNPAGDFYGEQRLETILLKDSDDKINAVIKDHDVFRDGADQDDDTSMVEIICCPVTHDGEVEQLHNSSSALNKKIVLPLETTIKLTPELIRSEDTLVQLLQVISHAQAVEAHKDFLFTLLSELYNNAVDHGLLLLDSSIKKLDNGTTEYYEQRNHRLENLTTGEVTFQFSLQPEIANTPASLRICVTDTGPGFDYQNIIDRAENDDSFGRGISLIKSLCEEINFSNEGNTIEVTYLLD